MEKPFETNEQKLVILCADTPLEPGSFNIIVTMCPIQHRLLEKKGVPNFLFADFSPNEQQAKEVDSYLREKIEDGLHKERESNSQLKWAPLALQQVRWRLSHYLWVKECLKNIFNRFNYTSVFLSSQKQLEFVLALKALTSERDIPLEIGNGEFNEPPNRTYLCLPYDLPEQVDPSWFVELRWRVLRLLKPKTEVFYQWYWNLGRSLNSGYYFSFNHYRGINFLGAARRKLLKLLKLLSDSVIDCPFSNSSEMLNVSLTAEAWQSFTNDEKDIIRFAIKRFFDRLPSPKIDAVEKRLNRIFQLMRPKKIILSSDQICSGRLLAYVAHRNNVQVDYLPHGICWEDLLGPKKKSVFSMDHVLAWSIFSKQAYERLGWSSYAIAHPRCSVSAKPYKPLKKKWEEVRVLFLVPEWFNVSLEGRHDILTFSMIAVYEALMRIGVRPQNFHVKMAHAGAEVINQRKMEIFDSLKRDLGMDFIVCDSRLDSFELMADYDLVISGKTTGLFEVILQGIPLIIFAHSIRRIGALQNYPLSACHSAQEIYDALKDYDHEKMRNIYGEIVQSLQSGQRIDSLIGR